jgi:hypothetical protein
MKTKIVSKTSMNKNPDLPCLMINTDLDLIVLFTGVDDILQKGVGIVLTSNIEQIPIGKYGTDWFMEGFVPFTETLILENTYES